MACDLNRQEINPSSVNKSVQLKDEKLKWKYVKMKC